MAVVSVQPIAAGYAYGLRLSFAGGSPPFPVGCAVRGEVRDYPGAPDIAGTLASGSGGLLSIIDPQTIEIYLTPNLTGTLGRTTCAIDLVRADVSPARWMGIQLLLPVTTAVTRSAFDALKPGRIIADGGLSALATISVPPGMTVTAGAALGPEPWNVPQIVAPAAVGPGSSEGVPTLTRIAAAVVSPALVGGLVASIVLSPSLVAFPPPPVQAVLLNPTPPATLVNPPSVDFEAPQVVKGAGVPIHTLVGSPLVSPGGIAVLGPASLPTTVTVGKPSLTNQPPILLTVGAEQITTILPSPTLSQPTSSSSYVADGYVADGYVGAS